MCPEIRFRSSVATSDGRQAFSELIVSMFTGSAIPLSATLRLCVRPRSRLHQILLYPQVPNDELLPLAGVLPHEEAQQIVAAGEVVEVDRVESDVFPDEVLELS